MKSKKEVSHPLVLVVWTDTINNVQWKTAEELEKWSKEHTWQVHTVGYLVSKTKEHLVVATSWAKQEKQYMGLVKIPRAWAKIIPLKEPKGA